MQVPKQSLPPSEPGRCVNPGGRKRKFLPAEKTKGAQDNPGNTALALYKKETLKEEWDVQLPGLFHLEPHEPPLGRSDQGTDPLDSSGFQEIIRNAREILRSTKPLPTAAGTPCSRPKSRHVVIEEKLRVLDTPKVITQRPKIRSTARVPPGSTLVTEIRRQAEGKQEIKDLFGSDSEELPARLWKRLGRSVTKTDVNNI